MAAKFKINLDLMNFNKLTAVPKILNKMFQKTEKYNRQLDSMRKRQENLLKVMKKQRASSTRIWIVQKKMAIQNLLLKASNPWPSMIAGAKAFGLAVGTMMKTAGIGLLIAGLALIGKIGKKAFQFNIGGSKEGTIKVLGKLTDTLGKAMKKFYEIIRQLDPALKPFTDFFVNAIFKGIDGIVKFSSMLFKSMGGIKGLSSLLGGYVKILMGWYSSILDAFKSMSEGMGGAGGLSQTLGSLFKSIFKIVGVVMKLITAVVKLLDAFGLFKAIGFIFKALSITLTAILDVITFIVDKVAKAVELYTKFINFTNKEAGIDTGSQVGGVDPISQSSSTSDNIINNNQSISVHTQKIDKGTMSMFESMQSSQMQKDLLGSAN